MQLTLYQCSSDRKKVGKALQEIATLDSIKIKEGTDIIRPTFTFHKFENWKNFNYCMLKWEGMTTRYYFIKNFVIQPGGIIEITCEVDVLETYKKYIKGLYTLVSRQENLYNKTIQDEQMTVPLNRIMHSINIGTVGDGGDGSIVLTVSG